MQIDRRIAQSEWFNMIYSLWLAKKLNILNFFAGRCEWKIWSMVFQRKLKASHVFAQTVNRLLGVVFSLQASNVETSQIFNWYYYI